MAYGQMGGAAMSGEDLYGDDAGEAMEHGKDEGGDGEDKSDSTEAILPKSILAGKHFDVGDEVVLKITAMHDDRISVKYAPAKEGDDGKDEGMGDGDKADMPSEMASGGGDSNYD